MFATYHAVVLLFAAASRTDSVPALTVSIACIDRHCCPMRINEQFTSFSTLFLRPLPWNDGGLPDVCVGCA